MKFLWSSFKRAAVPKTIGSVIEVDLPLLGITGVVAKVDTGAFSGALHVTNIREVSNEQGKRLRFSPLGSPDHTIEINKYHRRKVKSSNGQSDMRYAIDTDVTVEGSTYPITLTLTNRGAMKRPMLIGRNFLRLHGFLIDVKSDNE
jgi:hypothetical protein